MAITAVKRIVAEQQVAHFAHIAVFAGIAAFLRQTVTIAKILIGILICNIQRLYADFFQRKQLLFLADTILIQIAPYAQFAKVSIFSIDHAVTIRIIFHQSRIAVCRLRAVFQNGTVAEKLLAVIDDAIAVAVNNQQTVVWIHPAWSRTDTVAIMVEQCAFVAVVGNGFDTVAVEVES